ncbi:hypothetical protein JXJ21_13595 [candidate division KSB1 bacterium]|nr:hypothetical protein [candidate division KSB1 bacterium]
MKKSPYMIWALCFIFICLGQLSAQKLELIFSHKYHQSDVGTSCSDCHARADSSKLAQDNLLPDMETCFACHDSEGECTLCHKDPDNAISYPRIDKYIAYFPHAIHLKKDAACSNCHQGVEKSDNITEKHLPKMALCVTCHSDIRKDSYCNSCHAAGENLKPGDHLYGKWQELHGIASYCEEKSCQACHTSESCLNCHQGDNLDHKVHALNFINHHGMYSKANKSTCITCHEEQAFCNDCHRQRMVMPRDHAAANWAIPSGTGGMHARKAKMDLDNCISCHSDAAGNPVCIQCHTKKK